MAPAQKAAGKAQKAARRTAQAVDRPRSFRDEAEGNQNRMARTGCAAPRLLVDFRYGIGLAGLVSRCPAGRSLRRLPTCWVWLSSGLRPRRSPWRGVAPQGIARLEVALPVLADVGSCE